MDEWNPAKRLQYLVRLGVKNRSARFTRDFGGEELPEPDSLPALELPAFGHKPMLRLLYVLKYADDVCLDGPTARSIMGSPGVSSLVRLIKEAVLAGYARRTGTTELADTDSDMVIGLVLTEAGRRHLEGALHLDEPRATQAP